MATQAAERPADTQAPEAVVVRFAGDSGDGMQLTGGQFTLSTALAGNDLATFPDFPAEIRAPQGTLFGVSAFQINFGSTEIETAGDAPDVLVAMNPAALKTNLEALKPGGLIIADTGEFTKRNLEKAKYETNPLEDGSLAKWDVLAFDISRADDRGGQAVRPRQQGRAALARTCGRSAWRCGCSTATASRSIDWLKAKFKGKPEIADANIAALNAGHAYGETAELSGPLKQAAHRPGRAASRASTARSPAPKRSASASSPARSWPSCRCSSAAIRSPRPRAILHHLVRLKEFGITTFQAEDEIAAICAAIGASYAGPARRHLVVGPGHRAQDRGDGPRDHDRAAAGDRQLAARRALDRPADQDRAERPLPGGLRPQRRRADAGDRRALARRRVRSARSRPAASRCST